MPKQHKHHVVVEITTNEPLTEREATRGLQFMLNCIDTGAKPLWFRPGADIYVEKLIAKSFLRVTAARTAQ